MQREAFIKRVRDAAQQGCAYRVSTRSYPDDIGYVGFSGDACEKLAAEIVAVGGEAYLVDDLLTAREVVLRLCQEAGAKSALCWQHELLDRLGLTELLATAGIDRIDHDTLLKQESDQRRI